MNFADVAMHFPEIKPFLAKQSLGLQSIPSRVYFLLGSHVDYPLTHQLRVSWRHCVAVAVVSDEITLARALIHRSVTYADFPR